VDTFFPASTHRQEDDREIRERRIGTHLPHKEADDYDRSDLIPKGGWATMPGSKDPVVGAADICAQQLMNTSPSAAK
jgi:hypothetical protein